MEIPAKLFFMLHKPSGLRRICHNIITCVVGGVPNFFKRVLFFISINLGPVFTEQIKSKADEMLSGWSEVCGCSKLHL